MKPKSTTNRPYRDWDVIVTFIDERDKESRGITLKMINIARDKIYLNKRLQENVDKAERDSLRMRIETVNFSVPGIGNSREFLVRLSESDAYVGGLAVLPVLKCIDFLYALRRNGIPNAGTALSEEECKRNEEWSTLSVSHLMHGTNDDSSIYVPGLESEDVGLYECEPAPNDLSGAALPSTTFETCEFHHYPVKAPIDSLNTSDALTSKGTDAQNLSDASQAVELGAFVFSIPLVKPEDFDSTSYKNESSHNGTKLSSDGGNFKATEFRKETRSPNSAKNYVEYSEIEAINSLSMKSKSTGRPYHNWDVIVTLIDEKDKQSRGIFLKMSNIARDKYYLSKRLQENVDRAERDSLRMRIETVNFSVPGIGNSREFLVRLSESDGYVAGLAVLPMWNVIDFLYALRRNGIPNAGTALSEEEYKRNEEWSTLSVRNLMYDTSNVSSFNVPGLATGDIGRDHKGECAPNNTAVPVAAPKAEEMYQDPVKDSIDTVNLSDALSRPVSNTSNISDACHIKESGAFAFSIPLAKSKEIGSKSDQGKIEQRNTSGILGHFPASELPKQSRSHSSLKYLVEYSANGNNNPGTSFQGNVSGPKLSTYRGLNPNNPPNISDKSFLKMISAVKEKPFRMTDAQLKQVSLGIPAGDNIPPEVLEHIGLNFCVGREGTIYMDVSAAWCFRLMYIPIWQAATSWYIRNHNNGDVCVELSEEFQLNLRDMDTHRLGLVYQISGIYDDYRCVLRETCFLCKDKQSHITVDCIRYITFASRIKKISPGCIGCGEKNCTIGNNVHRYYSKSMGCTSCRHMLCDNMYFVHQNWLCDRPVFLDELRKKLIGVACVAAATRTWTHDDFALLIR